VDPIVFFATFAIPSRTLRLRALSRTRAPNYGKGSKIQPQPRNCQRFPS
jgi:hypothetical protein